MICVDMAGDGLDQARSARSVMSRGGARWGEETQSHSHSMLLEQGAEAAERLVLMLAETEDMVGVGQADDVGAYRASCKPNRSALESVSEKAAAVEKVDTGESYSMCCDSSAIQRGGTSGAGSMVEIRVGSKLLGTDRRELNDENVSVEGKNVLDFSLERSRSAEEQGCQSAVLSVQSGEGDEAHARKRQCGEDVRNGEEMDVLTQLLQKGRQMLSKLDHFAQHTAVTELRPAPLYSPAATLPSVNVLTAAADAAQVHGEGARSQQNASVMQASSLDSLISQSLMECEEELGSSLQMGDFEDVHAGLVDDLCRIGLDMEEQEEQDISVMRNGEAGTGYCGYSGSSPLVQPWPRQNQSADHGNPGDVTMADVSNGSHIDKHCSKNLVVSVEGDAAAAAATSSFALSVHISLVSIGGGRVTALRPGDLIYIHTVLTVPATEGDVISTTLHEQLRVPVPPDLPEGAAVSVEDTVKIRLSCSQLVALRSCSTRGGVCGGARGGDGGMAVRVMHQPRARVFGESGFKNVGEMTVIGVGLVDLESVWTASRWAGIVHLKLCEGQEQGRKVVTGKDKSPGLLTKGTRATHKSALAAKTASRYASMTSKSPGADVLTSAQNVVGRLELAVSLLVCAPDDELVSTSSERAALLADNTSVTADQLRKEHTENADEVGQRKEGASGVHCGDHLAVPGHVPLPSHQQQQQHQQDFESSRGGSLQRADSAQDEVCIGRRGERVGHDVWLLQLHDVVGVTWANALRVTCRMVWVEGEDRQPLLKACLWSAPSPSRPCAHDTIQLNVFQSRPPSAATPKPLTKTARSLFAGGGGGGGGGESSCREREPETKSKKREREGRETRLRELKQKPLLILILLTKNKTSVRLTY